jgi:hypothetical protein
MYVTLSSDGIVITIITCPIEAGSQPGDGGGAWSSGGGVPPTTLWRRVVSRALARRSAGRMLVSRRASENGRCRGLNLRARHNGSWRPMAP